MRNGIVDLSLKAYKKIFNKKKYDDYIIPEIKQISYEKSDYPRIRINLLTTSINKEDIYAGIKTAIDFFYDFSLSCNADMRIISMDKQIDKKQVYLLEGFKIAEVSSKEPSIVIDMSSRLEVLPVSCKDVFIATMWHTAYSMSNMFKWFGNEFNIQPYFIYLIQDYEPGFFPWSSRYLLAENTYHMDAKTIAVFNSHTLKEFFVQNGYCFYSKYSFSPRLNKDLKQYLKINENSFKRKKQILIYGRPTKSRNAFELLLMALDEWYRCDNEAKNWEVISAGESFKDIECPSGLKIKSLGKLSIEEYAKIMLETKIGISLMVSPHPSYPPLEMAAFGMKVITNAYANKELNNFNNNIVSIKNPSTYSIAQMLTVLTTTMEETEIDMTTAYFEDNSKQWNEIYYNIKEDLKNLMR